jgi:hypothetical protein
MSDINSIASAAYGQTPLALVRSVRRGAPPGSYDIVCGELTDCFLYDLDPPQRPQRPSRPPCISIAT